MCVVVRSTTCAVRIVDRQTAHEGIRPTSSSSLFSCYATNEVEQNPRAVHVPVPLIWPLPLSPQTSKRKLPRFSVAFAYAYADVFAYAATMYDARTHPATGRATEVSPAIV